MADAPSAAETSPAAQHRKLSVIVPVYNERNTVGEIVRRMRNVELPIDLEVVLVDDGSDDGTRALLPRLADSTVRIVTHDTNRGKGAAVRTGLAHATGDLVLIQDADLEYDPDEWPRLLAPVLKGRARVVYGSRFTGERRNMQLSSWLGNRLLVGVANVLFNTTLSDLETGYKLFDRDFLDSLHITADGFDFEPEVTARVLSAGERIYEVPISYTARERDEGKKITWRDGANALWVLARCRFGR
ncbi:MAG TPA: glycosyltransferase family 2 protein [Acidimicrobiia bacterium]|nr:glycosyltransferase family 2 protein [Acidimicrobiia bacterium]